MSGATYDIAKSRFAFGSTPVEQSAGGLVRWVGSDGAIAIFSDGSEMGSLNAGAPEANLPDWSTDATALAAHVQEYFASMGVAPCQIAVAGVNGSASGGGSTNGGSTAVTAGSRTVALARSLDGIPVVESVAWARFEVNDQSTGEAFYWPEIPADVADAARTFRDRLKDPSALAAYKALLPADAQGDGHVVIHHSSASSVATSFRAAATYDVPPQESFADTLSFDANGNVVTTNW